MSSRYLTFMKTAIVIALGAWITDTPVAAQTAAKAKSTVKRYVPPRTPDGRPDLQGLWNNATTTPLQRPDGLHKDVLSDEETAEVDEQVSKGGIGGTGVYRNTDLPPDKGDPGTYNEFWWERGKSIGRTSLIVDPENGRLPPLTVDGEKRAAAQAEHLKLHPADSAADRPLQERCLLYHGVPPLPTGYNNNYRIVQTRDHLAILVEMIHEVRLIPLDGRPHLAANVPQWMGDSRGRWEGDTLVVETTNFTDKLFGLRGIGVFGTGTTHMKVTERFTRTDAETIDYRFTVEDPTTFTKPFTALLPMRKIPGPLLEYACHEGNYGLHGILAGARAQEKTR